MRYKLCSTFLYPSFLNLACFPMVIEEQGNQKITDSRTSTMLFQPKTCRWKILITGAIKVLRVPTSRQAENDSLGCQRWEWEYIFSYKHLPNHLPIWMKFVGKNWPVSSCNHNGRRVDNQCLLRSSSNQMYQNCPEIVQHTAIA